MDKNYKPITSMKEVPEQLRKLRRQYLRYQQAEIIYSISHKKLFELASDAGAIYRIDGTVLIKAYAEWKIKQQSVTEPDKVEEEYEKVIASLSPEQEEAITKYCDAIFSSGADTEEFFYRLGLKDGLKLKKVIKSILKSLS